MARNIVLLTIAALTGPAILPAGAQELLDFRQVILCKSLRDNTERLQCFDRAVSSAPSERTQAGNVVEVESAWQITESRLPTDNLPRFAAVLQADEGTAALVLRCNDKITDVYVNLRTYVGGVEPLPITYRFNDDAPTETRWLPSREGGALFLGTPTLAIAFARTLPDDATLYVKVRDFQNRSTDMTFKLGPVSDIRDKIAAACQWPDSPPAAQVAQSSAIAGGGTSKSAPTRVVKHQHLQAHQQRWNINAQR
ncbi:MAG: type VI secretion system-associated protein TagO [Xanthobacteraceae bacterium]